jgi:hypothetical protein
MALDEEGWLRPRVIACPQCATRLFRVDHSPFDDAYLLYCDRCPRAAEVSFYDPGMDRVRRELTRENIPDPGYEALMRGIEARLLPCSCGGRFRHDASRRCFHCGAEVVTGEPGVDLSPYTGCEDQQDRDPTDEEQAVYDRFVAEFIRKEGHWASPS